jgi:hypothetical protein
MLGLCIRSSTDVLRTNNRSRRDETGLAETHLHGLPAQIFSDCRRTVVLEATPSTRSPRVQQAQ